jgi:hypothetical protein
MLRSRANASDRHTDLAFVRHQALALHRAPRDFAVRHEACARSEIDSKYVEVGGIEPPTLGLQSRCSPAELNPRRVGLS